MARGQDRISIVTVIGISGEFEIEFVGEPQKDDYVSHPHLPHPDGVYRVHRVHHRHYEDTACGSTYMKSQLLYNISWIKSL